MKKKLETGNLKLEELLKSAGFQTLEKRGERIIHASGAVDFGKSHAIFLKTADKHPALIGCSEFPSLGNRTLLVHVRAVETVQDVEPVEIVNPQSEIENAD